MQKFTLEFIYILHTLTVVIKMKNKHNRYFKNISDTPSSDPIISQPLDCFELINKYGTYEIQPTADSDHDFPKIAQGLPSEENRKLTDND